MSEAPRVPLCIRVSEYRGKSGFTISGVDGKGRRAKVFAETRAAAEHIKQKLRDGDDIVLADFHAQADGNPSHS